MLVGFSNVMLISSVVHLQYSHARIHGPDRPPLSVSRVFIERGAVQNGQLKQFLVHLRYFSSSQRIDLGNAR